MPKVPSNISYGYSPSTPYSAAPGPSAQPQGQGSPSHHHHPEAHSEHTHHHQHHHHYQHHQHQHSYHHQDTGSGDVSVDSNASHSPSASFSAASNAGVPTPSSIVAAGRSVVSAACLSCRAAKRKCDGERPVCTQCVQRGVTEDMSPEEGGCQYVASKRGGPRYKGVRGAAAIAKTEQRKREKEALAAAKATNAGSSASTKKSAQSPAKEKDGDKYTPDRDGDAYMRPVGGAGSGTGTQLPSLIQAGLATKLDEHGRPVVISHFITPTVPSSTVAPSQRISLPAMHFPPSLSMSGHHGHGHHHHHHQHGSVSPERSMSGTSQHHLLPPLSTGMVGQTPLIASVSSATSTTSQGHESISPALSLLQMSGSVPVSGNASSGRGSPVTDADGTSLSMPAPQVPSMQHFPHQHQHHHQHQYSHQPHQQYHQLGWRATSHPNMRSAVHSHVSTVPSSLRMDSGANTPISRTSSTAPSVLTPGVAAMNVSGNGGGAVRSMSGSAAHGGPGAKAHSGQGMAPSGWVGSSPYASRDSETGAYMSTSGIHGQASYPSLGVLPHHTANIPVPEVYAESVALVGDLSFANLEMWSKLQHYQLPALNVAAGMPGAGVPTSGDAAAQHSLSVNTSVAGAHASYPSGGVSPGAIVPDAAEHATRQTHGNVSHHAHGHGYEHGQTFAHGQQSQSQTQPHQPQISTRVLTNSQQTSSVMHAYHPGAPGGANTATFAFADFISKLEALPKAGVVGSGDEDEHEAGGSGHDQYGHHGNGSQHGGHGQGHDGSGAGSHSEPGGSGASHSRRASDEGSDGRGQRLRSTFDTERRVKAL
ncbi:hypothetical protein OC835_004361 [Tilletia horrida]|nr:hypothetical protein OC835_004361 [Tilletia horrida]